MKSANVTIIALLLTGLLLLVGLGIIAYNNPTYVQVLVDDIQRALLAISIVFSGSHILSWKAASNNQPTAAGFASVVAEAQPAITSASTTLNGEATP